MAEDMIERAARSTFLVGRDWDDPLTFDTLPDYGKDVQRDIARAALLAALDPEDAERVAREWKPFAFNEADPLHAYRGAIRDAAINDARGVIEAINRLAQGEQPVRSDMREKD